MKHILIVASIVIAVLFGSWFSLNCWTITGAGHGKVGVLMGDVDPTPISSGFSFVNPIKKFIDFDLKDQSYTWENVGVPSRDKLTTTMDVTVIFDTNLASTPEIYRTIGTLNQVVSKHLTKKVMSSMREVGKSVAVSEDFFNDATQTMMQVFMEDSLREYFSSIGVNIKSVLFNDVVLPRVVQDAVIKTKERTEAVNQERAQLEIVELQQQKAVKIAEANNTSATQNAEATIKNADAEAHAILIVKTAEANGNAKLAKSITPELVEYVKAKGWNGSYITTSLGATTPMLNLK